MTDALPHVRAGSVLRAADGRRYRITAIHKRKPAMDRILGFEVLGPHHQRQAQAHWDAEVSALAASSKMPRHVKKPQRKKKRRRYFGGPETINR
jgi:hypothetical protein